MFLQLIFIQISAENLVVSFMKGDTKITIGKKKTIFVRNKVRTEKMKMPFLIPYNKKIIVQNRTR